jgi:hypothetical protein
MTSRTAVLRIGTCLRPEIRMSVASIAGISSSCYGL